jgi:FixJ family two-component response regulator
LKGPRKVLVVDDDPEVLQELQRMLWLEGYEPILFSSANAFKDHTDFADTICVILDVNLNDGSGIELLDGLQRAGCSVPIVCMTGDENAAVRKAALNLGCSAFLTKPFAVQELMEPLRRAAQR